MAAKSVNIGIKRNHTAGTAMFLHRFHNPPLVFIRLIAFHGVQWGYSIVTPTHIELIIQCCCTYGTEKLTSIKKGIFFLLKKKNLVLVKLSFFSHQEEENFVKWTFLTSIGSRQCTNHYESWKWEKLAIKKVDLPKFCSIPEWIIQVQDCFKNWKPDLNREHLIISRMKM